MIVLDTNVLSELARQRPDTRVLSWLDALPSHEVATTTITTAELLYGVTRLPNGNRNNLLIDTVQALINKDFHGRIEPFDVPAASRYAIVVTEREQLGRPISVADAQIAAICYTRQAALATRNTKDFTDTGIELINPWHHKSETSEPTQQLK